MYLQIIEFLSEEDYDGGFASTPESEYQANAEYWLNGWFAGTTEAEYGSSEDWPDGGGAAW